MADAPKAKKKWGTPLGGYRFGDFARQFRPTKLKRQLSHLQPFRPTNRRNLHYSMKSGLEGIRHMLRNVLSSMDADGLPLLEGTPVGPRREE